MPRATASRESSRPATRDRASTKRLAAYLLREGFGDVDAAKWDEPFIFRVKVRIVLVHQIYCGLSLDTESRRTWESSKTPLTLAAYQCLTVALLSCCNLRIQYRELRSASSDRNLQRSRLMPHIGRSTRFWRSDPHRPGKYEEHGASPPGSD